MRFGTPLLPARCEMTLKRLLRASLSLTGIGLLSILLATPAAGSHDKTDIVKLTDGSTYIGEIKSIQLATLTLKTSPAGLLSIEWRYVTALTSKYEYRIELSGGKRLFGSLGPAKEPGHLSIIGPSGPIEVELADVVQIVPIEHGFWKRLDGSANFGLTYTQANNALQYNLSGDVAYRTRKNLATLSGQSIFSTQEGSEATSQYEATLVFTQLTRKRWGSFEFGQVGSNPAQGYDLRTLLGGGAANFFIETSLKLLTVNLGAVYNRELVTDSADVNESAEALAGATFRRFKRGSHSPSVTLSLITFTRLTDTSRFRAAMNFDVGWKIVGDLKFSFQVNNSYDSKPPGTDSNKNNLSIVTSVGYTF